MIKLSIKEWINLPESMAIEYPRVNEYTEKDWIAYEYRKNRFEISRVKLNFNYGEVVDSDGIVISRVKTDYCPQRDEQKRYCKECVRIFYITTNAKMLYCSIDCLTESILRKQFREKKRKKMLKQRREKALSIAIDTQERKKASSTLFKELGRHPISKEITKWIDRNII